MQRDDVRSHDPVSLYVPAADLFEFRRAMYVKADHFAAKTSHDPGKDRANLAGSDHSHSTANEIKAHEAVECEITLARAIVSPMDLPIERKEQANGKLGHGVRRIVDDPHDRDAELFCCLQVDVIEAGGARRHKLRAAGGELLQHRAVDNVVDEHADSGKPRRQRCRIGSKEHIEVNDFVPVSDVQLINHCALVILATEHCDPHLRTSQLRRHGPISRGQDPHGDDLHDRTTPGKIMA